MGNREKTSRIVICGGRHFNDRTFFNKTLDELLPQYDNPEIISGHASGADTLAERYAEDHGIPYIIFKPDWKRYGRGAGPIRNKAMIDYASEDNPVVIAFWNGESKGTRNMIDQGRKRGAIIHVIMCQDSATDHENLIE